MRILLDTQVFLWACLEPEKLSVTARGLLEDRENELLLSAVSSWEIALKVSLEQLELPAPPARYVPSRLDAMGLTPLPVEHGHVLRVSQLPSHHNDPVDRVLVAQSQLEDAILVTADPQFLPYDVDVVWAGAGEPPSGLHDRPRRRWGRRSRPAPGH